MNGEETDEDSIRRYETAIHEGRDETLEILQYRKDGAPFRAMLFASPIGDGQGGVINHFLSYLDITRRYEAEHELRALTAELEARVATRTEELEAGTVDALVGSSEASEIGEEISDLQEEVRDLTQAEKTAQRRKEDAEETLRRAELQFEGNLGLAADEVAALALSKVEEIDAFKARLDQRFAEGRMSVLGAVA